MHEHYLSGCSTLNALHGPDMILEPETKTRKLAKNTHCMDLILNKKKHLMTIIYVTRSAMLKKKTAIFRTEPWYVSQKIRLVS